LAAKDEPTVKGAHFVPASMREVRFWGIEPGGALRGTVAGVRLLSFSDGTIRTSDDRLSGDPSNVVSLPARLGAGFVFTIGRRLWRADEWLSPAAPFYGASSAIDEVRVGLDRIYVRNARGSLAAVDARSGQALDLGALPSSPHLGRMAALDAWRALAIVDLRGPVLTTDAGSTWRTVSLPNDPVDVIAWEDAFAVSTVDVNRRTEWWRVRTDGASERLPTPPQAPSVPVERVPTDAATRIFGTQPLRAALEDGWPLEDGSAIVARDGALGRVRLSDGALVDVETDAFSFKPARCHALSLAGPARPPAFGFVCGQPAGPTIIYAWDGSNGRIVEIRRFEEPRKVIGFGNGALSVDGPCTAQRASAPQSASAAAGWCVLSPGGAWNELRLGEERERPARQLVVLADGRMVILHPPASGSPGGARLTLREPDGGVGRSLEVAVHLPRLPLDTMRVLRVGTWLEGFEERRPGVVGGWVDAAGSVVGIEISVDGEARVGEFIEGAGAPTVSGRWGLGWTASRRGFETTDGGMTWSKDISLPDRIAEPATGRERVCGPIGCIMAGWLRIGWGGRSLAAVADIPPTRTPAGARVPWPWHLRCERAAPPGRGFPIASDESAAASFAAHRPRTVPNSSAWGSVTYFPPFSGEAGPPLDDAELGLTAEATSAADRGLRSTPIARLYAWGPGTGDWNARGAWQVRWDSPWGGAADTRASAVAPGPWPSFDSARNALATGMGTGAAWSVAPGADADHALLVARRAANVPFTELWALERDRTPLVIQRSDGEPLADFQGAVWLGGHWYVATRESGTESPATVVWAVEGGAARELRRVPRAGFESPPEARLARRSDGRALAIVVEGQPDLDRAPALWLVSIDAASGAMGDPEPVRATYAAAAAPSVCNPDAPGWELDMNYPGAVELEMGGAFNATLQGALAHVRVSRDSLCIDRLSGSVEPYGAAPPAALAGTLPRPGAFDAGAHAIGVSVFSAHTRHLLRCSAP
jgi:hypothetical protein